MRTIVESLVIAPGDELEVRCRAQDDLVELHAVLADLDAERVRAAVGERDRRRLGQPVGGVLPAPVIQAAAARVGREIYEQPRRGVQLVDGRAVRESASENCTQTASLNLLLAVAFRRSQIVYGVFASALNVTST